MAGIPFNMPVVPAGVHLMPIGHYAISYDIFTRATEDDLPRGWHSHRSNTYRQIIEHLNRAGFVRMQYSDYSNPHTLPAVAWSTMVALCTINPPGKFESTVRSLKMHYIDNPHCIVTEDVQLGGVHSQLLRGPTPRRLVTPAAAAAMNPAPVVLAVAPAMPRYTLASVAAATAVNWMQ